MVDNNKKPMNKKIFSAENFIIGLLILSGVLIRVLSYHHYLPYIPNFAPIGALALFGGVYLKKKYALILPLSAMIISDLFIGFHNLIFFTWGSFVLIGIIGWIVKKRKNLLTVISGSLAGSILFYLVTNFAVWAFTPLYEKTGSGLIQCYIMAIPFFRNTVLGDLFYIGVFFGIFELVLYLMKKREKVLVDKNVIF